MSKKSERKKRNKRNTVNPENMRFGEIIPYGFVHNVYQNGRYLTSLIFPLYPPYFPYIQTPIRTPDVSSEREIKTSPKDVQNIVKKMINDYSRSNEFETNVRNVMKKEFSFLETEGRKNDPENDGETLGKQLQNYLDVKIEERMKKYDENFKRIEEKLSKLLEQKQPTVESGTEKLNDLAKQLDELKKRLDDITKQLPLVKESPPQAVQTVGEKVYTSTPQAVQTPEREIEPTSQVQSAMQPSTPIIEEIKNYVKEKEEKIKTRASTILEAYKLKDEEIQNLIDNYRKKGKSEEEILPLEIALAIKTRRIYYTIWEGNFEYRGDSRLIDAVKEIFDQNVEGGNEIYRLMYWPEEEVKRYMKRKKEEMEEAYEREIAREAGIFSLG